MHGRLWHLGQTRFVWTLLVELSLTLDFLSCLSFSASLTLSDSDVTAPSTMMLRQMSRSWAKFSQLSTSTLNLLNDVLSASLKRFFWPLRVRFPDFSSPKSNFLRRRVSCILITWPVHLSWYFISTVWRLIMSARARTWVCRILSCHLILRSFLRQFNS